MITALLVLTQACVFMLALAVGGMAERHKENPRPPLGVFVILIVTVVLQIALLLTMIF